ncbi:LuxR C-terminal-related transcriptional regulator [Cryobacterium sp. SO1]|uniref:LuxR C-terminal-related transcriptional regulator n=1 Tax=Cryobacterium sp. SO1 TaxID=1897061 RepID=UPI0021092AA1|nr:LuxR C-terminal-related transcriptional regulator [Cryobacterium sp. SO1]
MLPAGLVEEPDWYLHRPRLDALLERLRGLNARILVLWDAAGSGKTTLMANWARQLRADGHKVDWFTGSDLHEARGADEIRRRLTAQAEGPAQAEIPMPSERTAPSAWTGTEPRFVFVDDLHLAEHSARDGRTNVTGILEALVDTPSGIRLVVSGRHRPAAGTAPLEAAGVLIQCPDDTLAFTLAETFELAALHRIDLPADVGAVLRRHTGGWATGLALALTWRQAEGAALDLRRFDGDNPAVADYLAAEVVAGLDTGDRVVLMHSALSEVVALDLAVAVSDRFDAGDVLERLARHNTLIARDPTATGGTGYRYHPILLAYLQAEGRRLDAGAATARHRLASRWYADRACGAAAIEQSLLADDADVVGELLERFGLGLVVSGATDLVRRALDHIDGRVASTATLCLRLLLEPPYAPARRRVHQLLAAADAAVQAPPDQTQDTASSDRWAFIVEILHSFHATERSEIESHLETLQAGTTAPARQALAVDLLAATAEGRCLDKLGQPGPAEDILREVADTARLAEFDWLFLLASDLAATAAGHAGNWLHVAMLEGQMAATAPAATTSTIASTAASERPAGPPMDYATGRALLYAMIHRYEGCEPVDQVTLEMLAAVGATGADAGVSVPAEVLLLLGQLDNAARARQALDRLILLMREVGAEHPRALSLCCIPLIEVSGALDGRAETQLVVRLIERALGEDSLESLVIRFLLVPPTRAGHPAEERLRAAALEELSAWRGSTIVSAWLALAHVAEVSGRHVEADARLLRALRLASRLGCIRPFLALGGQGSGLIRGRIGRLGDLDDFARHILQCADKLHAPARPSVQEHSRSSPALTQREREVLRELPFHQSVADIARKRNVSPNTVKTHLRNIYQKLEATNRTDAVAIAQDRGLL